MTIINALVFVVFVLVCIYWFARLMTVVTRILVYPFAIGCGIVLLACVPIYNLLEPWIDQWKRYGWRGWLIRIAG